MKEEAIIQPTFELDEDGRITLELSLLAFNIKKEVVRIYLYFLTFLRSYEEKKEILKPTIKLWKKLVCPTSKLNITLHSVFFSQSSRVAPKVAISHNMI
jgi:hypothetical protein